MKKVFGIPAQGFQFVEAFLGIRPFDEFHLVKDGATYITWELRRIDPNLTESFYDSQWDRLIELRRYVTMIVLYTWNIYGEQSHIEPSFDGPASVGFVYLNKTQSRYAEFQGVER